MDAASLPATSRETSLPINGRCPTTIVSEVHRLTVCAKGLTGSSGSMPEVLSGLVPAPTLAASSSAVCRARFLQRFSGPR